MKFNNLVDAKMYEKLRLIISNSNPSEIFHHCVKHLYINFSQERVDPSYPPWQLLLILKWSFAFGGIYNKKPVSEDNFKIMINIANSLMTGESKYFQMKNGIKKFLRQLAFTQFWLQENNFDMYNFGKQFDYFLADEDSIFFNKLFKSQLDGLEIINFLKIAFVCASVFELSEKKDKPTTIDVSYIKSVYKDISDDQIRLFFKTLSLNETDFSRYCKNESDKPVQNQIMEETPLKKYPLLQVGPDNYLIYSPTLFFHTITSYVYDVIKKTSSGKFGLTFERTLKKMLDVYCYEYLDENAQSKNSKKVEFILNGSTARIFVEAKACEMAYTAKLQPDNDVLTKFLKNTIVKGVCQANEVAKNLRNKEDEKKEYILIVTYKELFLGNGEGAWEEFIKEACVADYCLDISQIVNPKNLFFLTVEDFEYLIAYAGSNIDKISQLLDRFNEDNQTPATAKFHFAQHLRQIMTEETNEMIKANCRKAVSQFIN